MSIRSPAGYNRDFNYITSYGDGSNEAQKLGIPGANLGTFPSSGMTEINIAGINPLGDRGYSPFQGGTNVFHYSDNLNYIHGAHAFDFGFDFRAMQENTLGDFFFAGLLHLRSELHRPVLRRHLHQLLQHQ